MDAKFIGLKALDIVAGLGAAVAGGVGGPKAAEGVMMAGGAIKDLANAGGEAPSRAERHDRADFQARETVAAKKQEQQAVASDDRASGRAELVKLGWSPEEADRILNGPQRTPAASASTAQTQPQPTAQPASGDSESGTAAVLGKLLKGVMASRATEEKGTPLSGAKGVNDFDDYQGSENIGALGTVLKSVLTKSS